MEGEKHTPYAPPLTVAQGSQQLMGPGTNQGVTREEKMAHTDIW